MPSLLRRVGFSFLLGFSLFLLGALLQGVLNKRGITHINIYVDDLVLGAVAGLVVFAYEQRRSRDIRQKLAVIAAMNHHVRNALQAISYVPYTEQAKADPGDPAVSESDSVGAAGDIARRAGRGTGPPAGSRCHRNETAGGGQTGGNIVECVNDEQKWRLKLAAVNAGTLL